MGMECAGAWGAQGTAFFALFLMIILVLCHIIFEYLQDWKSCLSVNSPSLSLKEEPSNSVMKLYA